MIHYCKGWCKPNHTVADHFLESTVVRMRSGPLKDLALRTDSTNPADHTQFSALCTKCLVTFSNLVSNNLWKEIPREVYEVVEVMNS